MSSENFLAVARTSSRRSSISSVTSEALLDRRAAGFDVLRHNVEDVKQSIQRLYRQLNTYEQKRQQLTEGLEHLKQANRDYNLKVRDLLDNFKTPPPTIAFSSYSSKIENRIGSQSCDSNRSSRYSSRSGLDEEVFDDDYDNNSSYDGYPNERNFTKSVENIDNESSEA